MTVTESRECCLAWVQLLIQGTLPSVRYAKAMSITLNSRGKVFDYATEFAQPVP